MPTEKPAIPGVIWTLLAANLAAYMMQVVLNPVMLPLFALWTPDRNGFLPWQIVTYAFLHFGTTTHLFVNLFALWLFGVEVERVLGGWRFAALFAASVVGAAAIHLFVVTQWTALAPLYVIGASGGVFGIMGAYAVLFGKRKAIMERPIPVAVHYVIAGCVAGDALLGLLKVQHVALTIHLGGFAVGVALAASWRRRGVASGCAQ